MNDLRSGKISFRKYSFDKGVSQEIFYKDMDDKDRFEFSFHIFRFCMVNFLKLYTHKNRYFSVEEMMKKYFRTFEKNSKKYVGHIKKLQEYKLKNVFPQWRSYDEEIVREFLEDFKEQFESYFSKGSKRVYFLRHQKTRLNKKDEFIGQKTDPTIEKVNPKIVAKLKNIFSKDYKVISSPLKRTVQSAELFSEDVILEDDLKEIDYGEVDGRDLTYLKKNFPNIIKLWSSGKDPRFPGGENQEEVVERVSSFIGKIIHSEKGNYAVFTHNVFIRCLLGKTFDVPMSEWYRIKVDYLEPLEFLVTRDNKFYVNLNEDQIRKIFKDFIPS